MPSLKQAYRIQTDAVSRMANWYPNKLGTLIRDLKDAKKQERSINSRAVSGPDDRSDIDASDKVFGIEAKIREELVKQGVSESDAKRMAWAID